MKQLKIKFIPVCHELQPGIQIVTHSRNPEKQRTDPLYQQQIQTNVPRRNRGKTTEKIRYKHKILINKLLEPQKI